MERLENKLYFDANIFIYAIEGNAFLQQSLKDFLDFVSRQIEIIVTSELTLAECLVLPRRNDNKYLQSMYLDALIKNRKVSLKNVDIATWLLASDIRAKYNFHLPDSVHIATAILNDCSLMTNDKKLKGVEGLKIFYLDDFLQS